MSTKCWARCPKCALDFIIEGVVVPCPVPVYVAALESTSCPRCGRHQGLLAYSPGLTPGQAKTNNSFDITLGT